VPETIRSAVIKLKSAINTTGSAPAGTLGYSLRAILAAPENSSTLHHPAYVPVTDVTGLPRVLLLGDSISIGYTLPVRRALRGVANVHRPAANCMSSSFGVSHLDEWLGEGKWDAVHVNFGLHDCVRDGAAPAVPLDDYQHNLEIIFERLSQTGARLVWANTTPVPGHLLQPDPTEAGPAVVYRESDVEQYNAAAEVVARAHGCEVDPLDQCVRPHLERLQRPNDVHFTKAGYAKLGRQVASFLRSVLSPPAHG
jgi:hypothetical protein